MTEPARPVARLPRERRVADLMKAARAVFAEKGYEGASVSEIAERAGLVEGNVYRHFDNKRALLVRVVEDWYEEMLSDYDAHLQGIQGTQNRLRYMIWRHLSTVHAEPALCRLVFGEIRPSPEYRKTNVFRLNAEYTRRTIAIVHDGIAAGELRADVPVEIVRDMIYGCIEHHTWGFLRGEGTFSPSESADAITKIIYAGLSAQPAVRADEPLGDAVRRLEQVADRLEGKRARKHVSKSPGRQSR